MFRKCSKLMTLKVTAIASMGARPTVPSLIGRRKYDNRLDDSQFMRNNLNSNSSSDDLLEGEQPVGRQQYQQQDDEDFTSFMEVRNARLGTRGTSSAVEEGYPHQSNLKPLWRGKESASRSSSGDNLSQSSSNSSSNRNKGKRIVVNAGGEKFETFDGTLLQYPQTAFGEMILDQITTVGDGTLEGYQNSKTIPEIFLDIDPKVFNFILQFLRTGRIVLPTDDEPLRFAINGALKDFGLLNIAFPPQADASVGAEIAEDEPVPLVRLPDVCVIQMCDHLQHDQGVKRHALNISYGSDGFLVRDLCKKIRKDLNGQLSNTYWQCYQTHERSMFLITTKVANGTADLMMASVTQRLIEHTEQTMGYRLVSSYVTLSPDIKNTNVRLFIHNLIFRRVRSPTIEDTDAIQLFSNPDGSISAAMGVVSGMQNDLHKRNREDETFVPNEEMFKNFEPPSVGPQDSYSKLGMPLSAPPGQRVPGNIWDE